MQGSGADSASCPRSAAAPPFPWFWPIHPSGHGVESVDGCLRVNRSLLIFSEACTANDRLQGRSPVAPGLPLVALRTLAMQGSIGRNER
jgi:hypothetical protein